MKKTKLRLVPYLLVSVALLLGFTNCGQPVTFETLSPLDKVRFQDIIVGNPLTSKSLLVNICSVISSCHPEVSQAACEIGVLNTSGIESQLGLPKGSMTRYSDIVSAESDGRLRADVSAASTCMSEIRNLRCDNALVQNAYDPSAADPFAAVAFMIPTASNSCPAVFSLPTRTEYFVATNGSDLNDGTAENPWATINHAAQSLVLGQEGAVVHVAPGIYRPQTIASCVTNFGYANSCGILTAKSGTATAPITYRSVESGGAKIVPVDAYSAWYNEGDYVSIVGFEIVGNSATNIGIQNEGSNVRVENNRVRDVAMTLGCSRGIGGGGIVHSNSSSRDNDSISNVVHDIGPLPGNGQSPGAYCNHAHGIHYHHAQGNIHNNLIYKIGTWGIASWSNASRLNITNNLLFNSGARDSAGTLIGGGIVIAATPGSTHDYSTVSNNIIRNNSGTGINNRMNSGTQNLYSNNVFYANGSNFSFISGTVAIGSIMSDPMMVSFTMDGKGDYRLQGPNSPAINAGSSACAGGSACTPEKDYTGFLRPYGGAIDIGPFEWHP